ncbi:MAG: membrane protein insertion efficiency factor YidD [Acidobacteria bacterium]|nr:membrane protein insertion efficiency factor YidD [Acidobacteriota bacterium]
MPRSSGLNEPVVANSRGAARSLSLVARLLLAAIRSYQVTFSQVLGGHCRFVPSCSAYATEAVARHGALRGGWLAAWRVARCQPLCRGGLDQVPAPRGSQVDAP